MSMQLDLNLHTEETLNETIVFRVTTAEKAAIKQAAQANGVSLSVLARAVLVESARQLNKADQDQEEKKDAR